MHFFTLNIQAII